MHIATLNVRTLNTISQLPELTTFAAEYDIDIVCIQEHKYHHSKVEIKYHNTGNRWIFIFGWKDSVNAIIGGVRMLLSLCTQKLLNSIKKMQPQIMVATFNGNPSAMINASDEMDLITFNNKLSSLVCSIPKHNVLIISGDINAQIGRNESNKFCLHNSSNRNGATSKRFLT